MSPDKDLPFDRIKLTEDQETEVKRICENNLGAIEKERQKDDSIERWRQYDNQYWGVVRENPDMLFNTHVHLTLKHCRIAQNRTMQAYFESDPIVSVSLRPESGGKPEDAELQEEFLDYEMDTEIPVEEPFAKIFHEAFLKDGGVCKLPWERNKEWKDGKDEIIYDAPRPYFVEFKDFFVSLATEGLAGLRKAHFMAERQRYNWYELLDKVKDGSFDKEVVEEMKWIKKEGQKVIDRGYLEREYEIYETLLFYDLEKKGNLERIIVWFSRDRKKILNCIKFPYAHNRPYYIPFFVTSERPGWHQPGLGRVLQPQNIIANAVMNFLLTNAFYQNTPLLRAKPNSTVAEQLLAKTWKVGDPLIAEKDDVEKFDLRSGDLRVLTEVFGMNQHIADDSTGVSSPYLSGRADPTDPDAPAKKAMALLQESNINVRAYILALLPSFQEFAYQILQLFAQMKGTMQFKAKRKGVLKGKKLFKTINEEQLRLRTNLTPNAYSFAFDKINQKRENMALVQFLSSNPMAVEYLQQNPQAKWNLIHILIKGWSDFWNQKVDEVWPTKEQFEGYMKGMQKDAFEEFFKGKVKEMEAKMMGPGAGPGAGAPAIPMGGPAGGMM